MKNELVSIYVRAKIQQTKPLQKFSSLYKTEPVYEGWLKVILLLQVGSHDFEPSQSIKKIYTPNPCLILILLECHFKNTTQTLIILRPKGLDVLSATYQTTD